jgi:hypothetical protein
MWRHVFRRVAPDVSKYSAAFIFESKVLLGLLTFEDAWRYRRPPQSWERLTQPDNVPTQEK